MSIKHSHKSYLRLNVLTQEEILRYSNGEIKTADTLHYKKRIPIIGGLFCPRIFGPTEDYKCYCGNYKDKKYAGVVCEKCRVAVVNSDVRRHNMGHITLALPVPNLVLYHSLLKVLGLLKFFRDEFTKGHILRLSSRGTFEAVPYSEKDFAIQIHNTLCSIELDQLCLKYKIWINNNVGQNARFRVLMQNIMITRILVLPAGLRPIVFTGLNGYIPHDLNAHYRRILYKNNRLKQLSNTYFPMAIFLAEYTKLVESVNNTFWNGKLFKPILNGKQVLNSVAHTFLGKDGLIRQGILAKRVDYSARAVITVAPHISLENCLLPKKIFYELAKFHIIHEFAKLGHHIDVASYTKSIYQNRETLQFIVERLSQNMYVILNRAPSLHRLSMQAFKPILTDADSIGIHPLVCKAYNADFDGDQMSVHLPLFSKAIKDVEDKIYLNNVFSPSTGALMLDPVKDIKLGLSLIMDVVDTICAVKQLTTIPEALNYVKSLANPLSQYKSHIYIIDGNITTTVGRLYVYSQFEKYKPPLSLDIKADLLEIINKEVRSIYREDKLKAIQLLDKLKEVGISVAHYSGISIGHNDFKNLYSDTYRSRITEVLRQYDTLEDQGLLGTTDRHTEIFNHMERIVAEEKQALSIDAVYDKDSPFRTIIRSKARGNNEHLYQVVGRKGSVVNENGQRINTYLLGNYHDGLNMTELFISSSGARRGLLDKSLGTADTGYFSRKVEELMCNYKILDIDCGTSEGVTMHVLDNRIITRYTAEAIYNTAGNLVLEATSYITETVRDILYTEKIYTILVRDIHTCLLNPKGLCSYCYGDDLSTARIADIDFPYGLVAAQAIAEPGLQLMLRTFHSGGVFIQGNKQNLISNKFEGFIRWEYPDSLVVEGPQYLFIVDQNDGILEEYEVEYGFELEVKPGTFIEANTILGGYPAQTTIYAPSDGIIFIEENHIRLVTKDNTTLRYPLSPLYQYMFSVTNGASIFRASPVCTVRESDRSSRDISRNLKYISSILENNIKNPIYLSRNGGVVSVSSYLDTGVSLDISSEEGVSRYNVSDCILYVWDGQRVNFNQSLNKGEFYATSDYLKNNGPLKTLNYYQDKLNLLYKASGAEVPIKHLRCILHKLIISSKGQQGTYNFISLNSILLNNESFVTSLCYQQAMQTLIKAALKDAYEDLTDNTKGLLLVGR